MSWGGGVRHEAPSKKAVSSEVTISEKLAETTTEAVRLKKRGY